MFLIFNKINDIQTDLKQLKTLAQFKKKKKKKNQPNWYVTKNRHSEHSSSFRLQYNPYCVIKFQMYHYHSMLCFLYS